jgi:hypothetical protein
MAADLRRKKLIPFEPENTTPLDLHVPTHGNILAMMAESGERMENSRAHGEAVEQDHAVAATLPVDRSVVDERGHMDHHRKPIISIHGKDVDEHEIEHKHVA